MGRRQQYFEGWYFKHRMAGHVFAAIPGMAVDGSGKKTAFIQTITSEAAAYHEFPIEQFHMDAKGLSVRIGANRFTSEGMRLELPGIRAEFRYGPLTELAGGDIMGPFAHLPLMECHHGIVSLRHSANGFVQLDETRIEYDGGSGYIEKDWGRSFPRRWVWLECHGFAGHRDDSIMLAIAEIPYLGARFTGIICVCRVDGVQHRIATYRGARIVDQCMEDGRYRVQIRQGRYVLDAEVEYAEGGALRAPWFGRMDREMVEYPCCGVRVRLGHGGDAIMDATGDCCGFECVT